MKSRTILSLFVFLLCLLSSGHAATPKLGRAAVPSWIRSAQEKPKAVNLEDISDGYYFEHIDYQVHLGTQTRFNRSIKVLSENAGAENAGQVNIAFEPSYQSLVLHELYVLREGKRIDRLQIDKFQVMPHETELSRSIYNGTYTAYYLLEDLRKDDKIVLSYSITGFNPVFGGKFFDTFYLQGFEPVGSIQVNYVVPKGRKLHFKTFLGAHAPQQQDLGQALSYYWDLTGVAMATFDTYAPLWYAQRERIECSEFANWSDVGQWAAQVNPILPLPNGSKLQQFADQQWLKAQADSARYAEAIADFVQNDIRYMGIEVGEYSHRANNPEKVFAQRYGDCKDKSVLLASLLQHKGIASKLVLANSMEDYRLDDYLPAPSAFNHMVLAFSIDGRRQYIDPTITNQGGEFRNRYFPFYGKVLHAAPAQKLHDTDKFVAGSTRVEEKFTLQKDGSAQLDVRTIYSGCDADNMRSYFKQTAKNQLEKSFLEYYQKLYKKASKRASMRYEDNVQSNVLTVVEAYSIKDIADVEAGSKRRGLSFYAVNLSNSLPEILETRQSPIALDYPTSLEHNVYIINPDGKPAPALRENVFTDRPDYYFGKSISNHADTIKIAFRLGFHDSYVKAENIPHYLTDFNDRDALFSGAIFLDDESVVSGSSDGSSFNWWAFLAFIGLMVLFTFLTFRFYNHREASTLVPIEDEARHDTIGSWLLLLAIALFVSPIRIFYTGLLSLSFDNQVWLLIKDLPDVSPLAFYALMIFELVINTLSIFLSIYCLYLLVKKRDIFPQTLVAFMLFQFVVVVIDSLLGWMLFKDYPEFTPELSEIVRALLFAIIWMWYILKSTRVRGTFVERSARFAQPPPIPSWPPLPPVPYNDAQESQRERPEQ